MVRISLVSAPTPLYLYVSTFRSMCAVPNMAVFCSSLTSWFPGMLLTYFLNDFEMVPVARIITGIIFIIIIIIIIIITVPSFVLQDKVKWSGTLFPKCFLCNYQIGRLVQLWAVWPQRSIPLSIWIRSCPKHTYINGTQWQWTSE